MFGRMTAVEFDADQLSPAASRHFTLTGSDTSFGYALLSGMRSVGLRVMMWRFAYYKIAQMCVIRTVLARGRWHGTLRQSYRYFPPSGPKN
jgi:hypothetical protein